MSAPTQTHAATRTAEIIAEVEAKYQPAWKAIEERLRAPQPFPVRSACKVMAPLNARQRADWERV